MPSPSYNLVKDDQDVRVPMYSDEEFFKGICFQAKVSSKGSIFLSLPRFILIT